MALLQSGFFISVITLRQFLVAGVEVKAALNTLRLDT
jgi:hypothetical protein